MEYKTNITSSQLMAGLFSNEQDLQTNSLIKYN